VLEVEQLLKEFKIIFAWTYKNLKRIPPKLTQHKIELDTTIPMAHQVRYKLNPNYAIVVKQDINKLLIVGFIQLVEEATWLSPIVVAPKKNGKLRICIDFKKLNVATKKDPYPLPFTNEMLNTIAGYETYSFLDGYSGYHQIFIILKDRYKTAFVIDWGGFIWKMMSFGV
jgi:hypothetical protein